MNLTASCEEIRRSIGLLFNDGDMIELRALDATTPSFRRPHTEFGYFTDHEKLVTAAAELSKNSSGVYITVNPIDPDLLARAANRTRSADRGDATKDTDVIEQRWLLIDIDPKRPTKVSATDKEKQLALDKMKEIYSYLATEGFPAPIVADSGNGIHLMYRIKSPDKVESSFISEFLNALGFMFDSHGVNVDSKVYNPARIWKLYGTVARKGDHTADRPHRLSRLLVSPDKPSIKGVSRAAMKRVVARCPSRPTGDADPVLSGDRSRLDTWIHANELSVSGPIPWKDMGRKWVFDSCPWNSDHTDRSAYIVQFNNGSVVAGCHHSSCEGHKKGWESLQELKSPLVAERTARTPVGRDQMLASTAGRPALSDLGNAKRLVNSFGHLIRYIPTWGQWIIYNGIRWKVDDDGAISRLAALSVAEIFEEAAAEEEEVVAQRLFKHALRSESATALRNMVNLCMSEEGISISERRLDNNPWLLNCLNGTVNLLTGDLNPHNRDDLLTKLTSIEHKKDATCPTWQKFLYRVLGGNPNLVSFIQRYSGYTCTGDVSEQVLVLMHGTGSNGKSTFLKVLQQLFGDYGKQANMELLMSMKNSTSHPTGMARLVGARFVASSEVERGAPFAEALVKQMTGGDTITARFMRKDFFEFEPTHKLWIAANHRPIIKGNDIAIWRRILLIPFTVTIPVEQQDKQLLSKLAAEQAGILNWVLQGCLAWQKEGLSPPEDVTAATSDYQEDMDLLKDFFDDWCEVGDEFKVTVKELYESYLDWCTVYHENKPAGKRLFGMMISERGFEKDRTGSARYWKGIRLKNNRSNGDSKGQIISMDRWS
tara:strand:+ start:1546 stop:4023 length:2478 start_codon:yes stop_codon:yes gene_type:complete